MKQARGVRNSKRSRQGSALITVMALVLLVPLIAGSMVVFSQQQAYSVKRQTDQIRAKALAEAGVNEAYSRIATNFAARTSTNLFPLTSFGGGTYKANITTVATNRALICCTGVYGRATARAILQVQNYVQSTTNGGGGPVGAYACAIMANGLITISGSGDFNVGTNGIIHGNNTFSKSGSGNFVAQRTEVCSGTDLSGSWTFDMDFASGGDCTISGSGQINHNIQCDALGCSGSFKVLGNGTVLTYSKSGSGGVMGTLTTGVDSVVPTIAIPNIDLTPYYLCASNNGQVFNGKSISGSSNVQPTGGVMWVNGNLSISGSGNLIGCFIATGNIDISGSGSQIKVNQYPALVSRDGTINISGSQSFHGLIYAKTGAFGKSGSGLVLGSIICGGNFTASGSWGLLTYEDSTPVAPGATATGSADRVVPKVWQD